MRPSSRQHECTHASPSLFRRLPTRCSIYLVHEDAKEKEFELEMSWISPETNGLHLAVPQALVDEAETKAKEELASGLE